MEADIQMEVGGGYFNCRVAGICIKDQAIFLSRLVSDAYWTFIGGKAAFGEDTAQAILREFREETGVQLQVERLLAVIENFFELGDVRHHQYLFLYLLKDEKDELTTFEGERQIADEAQGVYKWVPLEEIGAQEIRPACFREILEDIPQTVKHIINREW